MRRAYAVGAIFLSAMLMAGVALVVALRANAESDRKWCEVVTTMDDAYRSSPPQTDIGRKLANDMAELRRRLGCR